MDARDHALHEQERVEGRLGQTGFKFHDQSAAALMDDCVQRPATMLNVHFEGEDAARDRDLLSGKRLKALEFGLSDKRFHPVAKKVIRIKAKQPSRIAGDLDHLERSRIDGEKNTMRLYETRNMDRLPIAIGKIGDLPCCRQLLHSSPELLSARNCRLGKRISIFGPGHDDNQILSQLQRTWPLALRSFAPKPSTSNRMLTVELVEFGLTVPDAGVIQLIYINDIWHREIQ